MVFPQTIITTKPQETTQVGEQMTDYLKEHSLPVCLSGELGSGKTTFVQGLVKGLGIVSRLLSPTFIIVRRYSLPQSTKFFYHLDLYRLTKSSEFEALGLSEILTDPAAIVALEWPEKLGDLLPPSRVDVKFKTLSDGRHKIWMIKR